jgi:NitT/TauT family transport system ATP-binding protein
MKPTLPQHFPVPQINLNNPTQAILEVQDLGKAYMSAQHSHLVLAGVSFRIYPGEAVAVIGKTGVGKSTLLDAIAGITDQVAGSVTIRGAIGYVLQKDMLLPWRTVLRNISLPQELRGKCMPTVQMTKIMDELGLAACASRYPSELSGGIQQKVSIARVLVQNPTLMLLDEPFSAMDLTVRTRLIPFLRTWIQQRSAAVLLVTHSIDEALAMADRIIVLNGTPARVADTFLVDIPETLRDPASVRQAAGYSELFTHIWKQLQHN